MADCRRFESDNDCQLTIIGPEDDVVASAAQHAAASHGHQDTPELRRQLRSLLEPESAYVPGERAPELFSRLILLQAHRGPAAGRGCASDASPDG